jgi:hypothetical protein
MMTSPYRSHVSVRAMRSPESAAKSEAEETISAAIREPPRNIRSSTTVTPLKRAQTEGEA